VKTPILNIVKGILNQSPGNDGSAAVALLLRAPEENEDLHNLEILFVKRVDNPLDPWSGQMAFPGGKRESIDNSLTDTVIRETMEEVNIDLHSCQFLGILEPQISTPRPDMKIYPFVFLCDSHTSVVVNMAELEKFIWVSINRLQKNNTTASLEWGSFPAFIVDENIIWGLTYRIVTQFLSLLDGAVSSVE
jgi:8-oxo-dGTP pyrophosphatase MutT (NUDIX family)